MGDKSTNPMVMDFARGLTAEGRHAMRLETPSIQAVVDAGWAARKAGQLLGRQVRVTTSRIDEPGGGLVVTAVLTDH